MLPESCCSRRKRLRGAVVIVGIVYALRHDYVVLGCVWEVVYVCCCLWAGAQDVIVVWYLPCSLAENFLHFLCLMNLRLKHIYLHLATFLAFLCFNIAKWGGCAYVSETVKVLMQWSDVTIPTRWTLDSLQLASDAYKTLQNKEYTHIEKCVF